MGGKKDEFDVELKFKKGPGGKVICYSDDCPQVTGEGNTEDSAANHFWQHFNTFNEKSDAAARQKAHAAEDAAAATSKKPKKAA